jgi:DNA-binding NarL/FixJ family response regulator
VVTAYIWPTADSSSDSNTGRIAAADGELLRQERPGERRLRTALNCETEFEDRGQIGGLTGGRRDTGHSYGSLRTKGLAAPPPQLASLTGREREVVELVALGLANHEIAGRLVVRPATVRTHVSRAMTRLGARDRAQLGVVAYQTGLVGPGRLPAGLTSRARRGPSPSTGTVR